MRFLGVSTFSLIAAHALAVPAFADDGAEAYAGDDDRRTIIVTGASTGYAAIDSVTATKTDTPLIDIPQTINVVTREQLDDQALHSIGEVLRYIPGTTVGQGEGNRDQVTLRGQNTTSDFFVDGVRDDVQYYRGIYNLERVEILKGPYALIFGRGGGGGIINRVQKSPQLGEQFVAGRASVNTFGAYDFSADVNTGLGDGAAFRLNAVYEQLDGHRDFYDGERYAFNPYVAANLGEGWKIGLSYEYVNDDRVVDRGIPALGDRPVKGIRDQFFGVPGVNRTGLEAHLVKARIDGELAENLSLSTTVLYGDYDKFYTNVFANGPLDPVTNQVPLNGYSDVTERQNFIGQANLVWNITTGIAEHKILLGFEYGDQETDNFRRNAVLSDTILDLDNPVPPTVTFPSITRDRTSDVETVSAYVQDQISIGAHFDIIAGIRYDNFLITGVDITDNNRAFRRRDEKWSPRIGFIYKPQENISLYSSYSESFQPRSGNQFLSLTAEQENLEPEKFTNYEVGAKWNIRPDLAFTLAAFQLNHTNVTATDPNNPGEIILLPGTKVKGIELSLVGQILPGWQVSAAYAYQDAQQSNSNIRLSQVPKNQFSLWNRYDVTDALGVGIGLVHQGGQFASISNTVRLPSFTRVDAALYYDLNDRIRLQANVENLFDTGYFPEAHNNNNISTGAPINARFSVQFKY